MGSAQSTVVCPTVDIVRVVIAYGKIVDDVGGERFDDIVEQFIQRMISIAVRGGVVQREDVVGQLAASADSILMARQQPLHGVLGVTGPFDLSFGGPDDQPCFDLDGSCKRLPPACFENLLVDFGMHGCVFRAHLVGRDGSGQTLQPFDEFTQNVCSKNES